MEEIPITDKQIAELYAGGWITPEQSFDPNRDTTIISRHPFGTISGVLCLRPMFYVHSFRLSDPSLHTANRIIDAAIGVSCARGMHGGIFQISRDNEKMIRFILARGAVIEPNSDLYRLDVLLSCKESENGKGRLDSEGSKASGG